MTLYAPHSGVLPECRLLHIVSIIREHKSAAQVVIARRSYLATGRDDIIPHWLVAVI